MFIPNILLSPNYRNPILNTPCYILFLQVPCPTCDSDDFKGAEYRLTEENGIQYALKNNCKSPPISLVSYEEHQKKHESFIQ